jgi:hypothetical protein
MAATRGVSGAADIQRSQKPSKGYRMRGAGVAIPGLYRSSPTVTTTGYVGVGEVILFLI